MRQRCYTARPLREEARHKAYVLFYFLLFIVSFLGGGGDILVLVGSLMWKCYILYENALSLVLLIYSMAESHRFVLIRMNR